MPLTDAPTPTYDLSRAATTSVSGVRTRETREPPLRVLLGAVLRTHREHQGRTLRDVAGAAQVSVPYLSEVERGRKEPSSEVLAAVCRALGMRLVDLVADVHQLLDRARPTTGSADNGRLIDLTSRRLSSALASRTTPSATPAPGAGQVRLAA